MAALGSKLVTLADVAKNRSVKDWKVAEVLTQFNPMLQDIPYKVMNMKTYHVEAIRSALPAVYYRKANQPIPASKTGIEERTFQAAHFESKSQLDAKVAERGGKDMVAYNRWNEAQGHLQAHAIEHGDLMIYGSPEESSQKTPGLADVYSSLNSSVETSTQVLDGGGTGSDNTSIYLLHWGEQSIFGVYPEGTQAGLKRTDRSAGGNLVQIQGTDTNGDPGVFYGYEEQFEIDHGLVVKDYRQGVRIANLDVSNLVSNSGAADLIDLMISAHYKIHDQQNGNGCWYANRTVLAHLHKQARTDVGLAAGLRYENIGGQPILMFLDRPVKLSDALLNTEAQVTS